MHLDARCYYLRYIAHDWPDAKSEVIFKQIHAAMKPGYSKLIINEWVVPEQGASWIMTAMDLTMMSLFSAMERTEKQWRAVLDKAGFEVVKIYKPDDKVSECVIETVQKSTS